MKNIWVPLSGAIAQQRNVETIANNVANSNTAGFKKDQLVFKEYLTALDKGTDDIHLPHKEWKPEDFYKTYGAENSYVKVDGSYTVHDQGQLTPTGNPFDLAIHGKGFFEVLTPNGIRFSRAGSLTMNRDSTLTTRQGFPVLSEQSGEEEVPPEERIIRLGQGQFNVNLQGEISLNGNNVTKLSVVEFNDVHALKKEGATLFISPDKNNIKTANLKSAVHQGFVEESNVNAVSEMSALIKANRHFESIQRAIRTYDTMSGKGANEIARF